MADHHLKAESHMSHFNSSQLYIGTQNGIVVCVNQSSRLHLSGVFYHSYSLEGIPFADLGQLLFSMEQLFNELGFPYPSTNERRFQTGDAVPAANAVQTPGGTKKYTEPEKREKIMKDEELLMKHGDLGSFIIRVQHRQNSSWQGRITWIEKNQTLYFRSVWEMIKLIENAIDTVGLSDPEEKEGSASSWKIETEPE